MKERGLDLLRELTEAHAVPGREDEVREIFARELGGSGALSSDANGSVFCDLGGDGPRVLVAGHMDEVGFMVQDITPDGFLSFVPLGGWWPHTLLSQRVVVKTRGGDKVTGVIASQPPHFLPPAQRHRVIEIEQMFIDVGASSRHEVEHRLGIALGDPVAPAGGFEPMSVGGRYLSKAFDNRVGMAAAIHAGEELAGRPRPNHLWIGGTVQEEVGTRGAITAAVHAEPEVVVVLEGPPADDTPGFPPQQSQGKLGGGAQVRLFDPSAIGNPRLAELTIETARVEGIPHQVAVRRSGGTDAKSFHVAGRGIPCVVIGVPARYIHSHQGIIDVDDYLATVRLVTSLVGRLDRAAVDGLTRFL